VTTDWAPPLVVSVADAMRGFSPDVCDRLLTDPRMKGVWIELGRHEVKALPAALDDNLRVDHWLGQFDASPKDEAAVAFFASAVIIFTLRNRVVKKHELEKEAERWQDGAALCREALSGLHRARVDPALAAALSVSADYFEGHATSIKTASASSPCVVERNARKRAPGGGKGTDGNENVRGQVRKVAEVTEQIFGTFLYGTVACAASVATGLKISRKNVEKWCSGLSRVSP
jgi:hypothetical protein